MVKEETSTPKHGARVQWAENEVAYIYRYCKGVDTIVVEDGVRGVEKPAARCKQTREYLNGTEAIFYSKLKKKNQFANQLQALADELKIMDITIGSIADIEEMVAKIISQLDGLQRGVKAASESSKHTPASVNLEENLWLLVGLMHCWHQEIYADSIRDLSALLRSSPLA